MEQCITDKVKQEIESNFEEINFYRHTSEDNFNNLSERSSHEVYIKEEFPSDSFKEESENDNDLNGKKEVYIKEEHQYITQNRDDAVSNLQRLANDIKDEICKTESDHVDCDTNYGQTNSFNPQGMIKEQHQVKEFVKSEYVCNVCRLKFTSEVQFETHATLCQTKNCKEKRHGCESCNYRTNRLQNLKRHMLSHKGERSFKCSHCDYKAVLKSHVQVHIKYRHTKEKPFSCNLCDYKCMQYYMLNKHKMVHLPEKLYTCETCNKGFNQLKHLKSHMFKHTNEEKPFKCSDCDYSTVNVTSLTHHKMFKHTKEKPYKCTFCDYKCVTSGNLKKHMYTHSDDKPLKCKHCSYQCIVSRHLKTHVERHHS